MLVAVQIGLMEAAKKVDALNDENNELQKQVCKLEAMNTGKQWQKIVYVGSAVTISAALFMYVKPYIDVKYRRIKYG